MEIVRASPMTTPLNANIVRGGSAPTPVRGRLSAAAWRERFHTLTPVVGAKINLAEKIPDKSERQNVLAVCKGWGEFKCEVEQVPGVKGKGCMMLTRVALGVQDPGKPAKAPTPKPKPAPPSPFPTSTAADDDLLGPVRYALQAIESKIGKWQEAAAALRRVLGEAP